MTGETWRFVPEWDAEALTWRVRERGVRGWVGSFDSLADAEEWILEQPDEAS